MTTAHTAMLSKDGERASWRADLMLALLATLGFLVVNAWAGFPALNNAGGDNDDLLRLVEVRDLLAGQGWFDLHQYRMGLEGGFVMHWSRLVDAPIAAIVLAVSSLTGNTLLAENVAQVAWPALLFGLTMVFIIRAARSFAGDGAVLPAVIVGAAALYFIGIFEPAALDHHNVQLMLTVASLSFLIEAPMRRPAALLAGLCAALTLAVGMETAPYVAAIGVCVATLFAFDASGERLIARDFGLGFAAVAALVFVATVPLSAWGQTQCDAFSTMQFVVAALAGTGLAAIASLEAAGRGQRRLSLAVLGVALGAVLLLLFPQCLASPYAGLDPRLKTLWLDHVDEAQSLFQLAAHNPAELAARYATPLVALVLMALRPRRGGWRRQDSLVATLLVVAFLVSVWQVRGSTFSIVFAVIPLSAWIAKWRQRAETSPSRGSVLRMAAAWLLSVNSLWSGAAQVASAALATGVKITSDASVGASVDPSCQAKASFATLGRLPDTTVLAVSNIGSPILVYSGHRVFAGPYHRNVAGDLLALDAFLGSDAQARSIIGDHHVGLVALCRGNSESQLLASTAPDGFLAGLMRGNVPEWLEPIADTKGASLELYHVRPRG